MIHQHSGRPQSKDAGKGVTMNPFTTISADVEISEETWDRFMFT